MESWNHDVTISTGFGNISTGGGSSKKTKDRLKGIHLRFSKPGWDGNVVERDCKAGRVPSERDWEDYKVIQDRKKTNTAAKKTDSGDSGKIKKRPIGLKKKL